MYALFWKVQGSDLEESFEDCSSLSTVTFFINRKIVQLVKDSCVWYVCCSVSSLRYVSFIVFAYMLNLLNINQEIFQDSLTCPCCTWLDVSISSSKVRQGTHP